MARRDSLPPLLPAPCRAERREGTLRLRAGMPIVLREACDARDFGTARLLRDRIERATTLRLPVESHTRSGDLGPHIELERGGRGAESYSLAVDGGRARLRAGTASGLRYAAETFAQLIGPGRSAPCCEIEDAPDFARRGLLLDVSRGRVPTLASLRALIDRCAQLKLNTLMLYVEHPFQFRRHPEIGSDCSALDAETLRGLDDYAADQHVELVPNLQSLGHMERILRLPRYAELAETDARWTLAPEHPGSYALLRDLYGEFLPNFRSRLFHANCDEPWDLGRGQSAARAAALGPGGLFLEHVKRIRELALGHDRQLMIWADFLHAHPERLAELERDVVLCDWGYEADTDYDRVAAFTAAGRRVWVCPGTSAWNALFPRIDTAFANIAGWAQAGRRHGAEGLLLTEWGDFGHYNLWGGNELSLAWAAQQAWSGDPDRAVFERAFGRLAFGRADREAARLYRALGSCHGAGFNLANASPLAFLFFDDLERGNFLRAARAPVLRRTARRLARVCDRLATRGVLDADPHSAAEVRWAAAASLLAVEKALAAVPYFAWRAEQVELGARERRSLARGLDALALRQRTLGRELRSCWLGRNHVSDLAVNARRLERSVRGLRRAARELARNRPAPPPADPPRLAPVEVLDELREATDWPPLPGPGAHRSGVPTGSGNAE